MGGLLAGLILFHTIIPVLAETSILQNVILLITIFIFGNAGDLLFSKIKRSVGIKDFIGALGVTGLSKGETNKIIIARNELKKPIYVGDTMGDAQSAKVAEIPFVYARYGFGKIEEYDYVIDCFEELLTIR